MHLGLHELGHRMDVCTWDQSGPELNNVSTVGLEQKHWSLCIYKAWQFSPSAWPMNIGLTFQPDKDSGKGEQGQMITSELPDTWVLQ